MLTVNQSQYGTVRLNMSPKEEKSKTPSLLKKKRKSHTAYLSAVTGRCSFLNTHMYNYNPELRTVQFKNIDSLNFLAHGLLLFFTISSITQKNRNRVLFS